MFTIATTYLKIIRGRVEFIFVQVNWAKKQESWEGGFSVSYHIKEYSTSFIVEQ